MSQCRGTTQFNNPCKKEALSNTNFCETHKYMNDYTDEMLSNLTQCTSCNNYKYLPQGGYCQHCKDLRKIANEKRKEKNKEMMIKCKQCTNQALEDSDYCGKHQKEAYREQVESGGMRVCLNYIRGCKNILQLDDKYKYCETCRAKERASDKKLRKKIFDKSKKYKEYVNEKPDKKFLDINDDNLTDKLKARSGISLISSYDDLSITKKLPEKYFVTIGSKICSCCADRFTFDKFINVGNGNETNTCAECRRKNRIRDTRIRQRNWKAELERNPQRKITKALWKEKNYDKMVKYWMNYRFRKIKELGVKEYWRRNTVNAKKYRAEHPEKIKQMQKRQKLNPNYRYKYYERTALEKGIEFGLTIEQCAEFFKSVCFYCGEEPNDETLNGIDRMISSADYTKENCVPCCQICNYIKNCLDPYTFIKRAEHILTNLEIIEGKMDDSLFVNHKRRKTYNGYKSRANKKDIYFDISEDKFNELIKNNCYICGKFPSKNHTNGIDRCDNNMGYTDGNCETCCGECNYMKCTNTYDYFVNKLVNIYDYWQENLKGMNADELQAVFNQSDNPDQKYVSNNASIVRTKRNKREKPDKEDLKMKIATKGKELERKYGSEEYIARKGLKEKKIFLMMHQLYIQKEMKK